MNATTKKILDQCRTPQPLSILLIPGIKMEIIKNSNPLGKYLRVSVPPTDFTKPYTGSIFSLRITDDLKVVWEGIDV